MIFFDILTVLMKNYCLKDSRIRKSLMKCYKFATKIFLRKYIFEY